MILLYTDMYQFNTQLNFLIYVAVWPAAQIHHVQFVAFHPLAEQVVPVSLKQEAVRGHAIQ